MSGMGISQQPSLFEPSRYAQKVQDQDHPENHKHRIRGERETLRARRLTAAKSHVEQKRGYSQQHSTPRVRFARHVEGVRSEKSHACTESADNPKELLIFRTEGHERHFGWSPRHTQRYRRGTHNVTVVCPAISLLPRTGTLGSN